MYTPQASYIPKPVYQAAPAYAPAHIPAPVPTPVPAPIYPAAPLPSYTSSLPPSYQTSTPPAAPLVIASTAPPQKALPVYAPVDYAPAHISYPHNPVYNLVVPDSEHHKIKHLKEPKAVRPLAPPPSHKTENDLPHHDPYYKTEAEVAHMDFSDPFFYASTKKIARKDKKDKSASQGHEHQRRLYYY